MTKYLSTVIIGLLAILIIGGANVNAATWTVTKSTNSDDNLCDADCSLREAVFVAGSGDTIVFDANLVGQTFTLGGSQIFIDKRLTIDGFLNDPNVVFLSGSNTSRHFYVNDNADLSVRNMTFVQGNGKPFEAAIGSTEGGSIYVRPSANLTLNRVSVRGSQADLGGAIFVGTGTHRITNSSLTSNSASGCTAIFINGGNVYLSNVTVSGNNTSDAVNKGYAIWNNYGDVVIRNSTITNNLSSAPGANGGGILNRITGKMNIGNTIVAQNTRNNGFDVEIEGNTAPVTSVGGNLIGTLVNVPAATFMQPNDLTGVNPLLAPLNSNLDGFPVLSHPLQAGSPARNGGINANAVEPQTNLPLTTDARGAGFPRISGTTVDIGAFEDQTNNSLLVVNKKTNSNDFVCDLDCSLREAVHQASLNSGTDTITFAPSVFGTLALGGTEILIQNHSVNIVGYPNLNANTLIISGGGTNRIFRLSNATVSVSGLTLAEGNAGANFGGAILAENNSSLTLDKVIVRNNTATAYGAAHLSGGTHRIINSTIHNNSANTGLALSVSGTLNMANTTVSANFDADGGTGIGAIFVTGTANIRNSTIVFNRTPGGTGGGIFSSGTLNIGNSIVAQNIAAVAPDIERSSGAITSVGGNLVLNPNGFPIGTFAQTNDAVGVDPLLDALADNGGIVTTHSLLSGSPAINAGVNANAVDMFDNSVLTTDGRSAGFARIINTTIDKGAFEAAATTAAEVSVSGRVTNGKSGLARARVYLIDSYGVQRTMLTNAFGHFRFEGVAAGETYVVSVTAKKYVFATQFINVNSQIDQLNFVPQIP